jgi:glycosyltransferase involved in cell wall biosynthesis
VPQFFIEASIDSIFWEHPQPPFCEVCYFVGPFVPRKGIIEFVDAFIQLKRDIPGLKAYAIGESPQSPMARQLIERSRQETGRDDLVFPGPLSHREMAKLYRQGGLFVLSSRVENSPNVLMEAMAAGLAVVATDVGAVRFLVADRQSGFLTAKGDVNALAAACRMLLTDASLSTSFGAKGREIATGRWRPEIVCSRHLEMYRQILERDSRNGRRPVSADVSSHSA